MSDERDAPERIWLDRRSGSTHVVLNGWEPPASHFVTEYVRADTIDALRAELGEARLQALASLGQAQEAYEEQLRLTAEAEALRARVAELEGALRPFAQLLERYDLDLRPLIALVDDDTGERLNVSHADVWRAARAALKVT